MADNATQYPALAKPGRTSGLPDFGAIRRSMQERAEPDVRDAVVGIHDGVMAMPPFNQPPPADSPARGAASSTLGRLLAYITGGGAASAPAAASAPPPPDASGGGLPASLRSLLRMMQQ